MILSSLLISIAAFSQKTPAKMVLAKAAYPDYSTAAAHAVTEVTDGDSLWLYVQFQDAVKNHVVVSRKNNPDGSVSKRSLLLFSIGPKGNTESTYNSQQLCLKGCDASDYAQFNLYSILDEKSMEKNEFRLCLTGYVKNQSNPIFLKTVGGGNPGVWHNELRLYTGTADSQFPEMVSWKDDKPLGIIPILCNVDDGIVKYKKMLAAYNEVLDKGDKSSNVLPAKGKFNDAAIKAKVGQIAKTKGWAVKEIFFVENNWVEFGEINDLDKYRRVYAVAVYKKGTSCFFSYLEVIQRYRYGTATYGPSDIKISNEDLPIECSIK